MKIKRNYQRELETVLASLDPAAPPRLLLHSCCAPCSSYVLAYLSTYFRITVFYYNPNITPYDEYEKRAAEERRLIASMSLENPVAFLEGEYDADIFMHLTRDLAAEPEGGSRCALCYELRLRATALVCRAQCCDYFATTLTVSPYKNAQKLNEIGQELAAQYGIRYLCSDFKKRGGYQQSIALSHEYGLYRQNYCGCVFSKAAADEKSLTQNFPEPKGIL